MTQPTAATAQLKPFTETHPSLQQPACLRQRPEAVQTERDRWCSKATPFGGPDNYFVADGRRWEVPFPTRCFDRYPQLRHDAPLPWGAWGRSALGSLQAGARACLPPQLWTLSNVRGWFRRMAEPQRWRAFYSQGNFELCSVPRRDPTGRGVNSITLHWDACNSSAQCYETLRRKGLSAHLLLDADGTVYQMLDLARDKGFHAGWANEQSIGIEINNPVDPAAPAALPLRPRVTEVLPHTQTMATHCDFLPIQKQRLCELIDALGERFEVVRRLPPSIDAEGIEAQPQLMPNDFHGVFGHYHVSPAKVDPGLSLWPTLTAHWSAGKGPLLARATATA